MRRLLLAAVLAGAATLAAHDLVVRAEPVGDAVIVRASYDGRDPAANADVAVYRPAEPGTPFQTGRTDRNGAFAFVPDAAGDWRVEIDDGFGHRVERVVATGGEATESGDATSRRDGARWQEALTGVSLLVGLTGLWAWRRART